MICLKCNARSESMDCTYEEIKYGLCWKCIKELRKKGELDSNSTGDDLINKRLVNLEQAVSQLEEKYKQEEQEELEWALSQFRYKHLSADERKALDIIESKFKLM